MKTSALMKNGSESGQLVGSHRELVNCPHSSPGELLLVLSIAANWFASIQALFWSENEACAFGQQVRGPVRWRSGVRRKRGRFAWRDRHYRE
jgi:hypothetical protein